MIVQCEIMEDQIYDLEVFISANENTIKKIDTEANLTLKSALSEMKAEVKNPKYVANDALEI